MSKKKPPVLAYLESLHAVRGTGKATEEQSYKSTLEALLNAIGEDFDPELLATMELKQEGAGQPDLGIFEKKSKNLRLVVEVKGTKDTIADTAEGAQVSKYWTRYGFVLVTNFRGFVLVAREKESGEPRVEARYQISRTHDTFWRAKPAALAKEHEERLTDFLTGVFARPSPILKAKDLAADLARHAREAKHRLARHSADALKPLQDAFEKALGLTFEDEKGLDFFRSSLVQTLFYGLFSGWMLWRQTLPKGKTPPAFDWKDASDYLALPLIGDLFDEVAKPKRLTELDLREPLEWAASSLNRVNHGEFFKSFDADHAITLFYEPFLQAFDPELRKQLGVWYTPPEIVTYMVERVDQLLRSELGIEDGLASDDVYVLDPATGTGSYLVEVAKRIHKTLEANGVGDLAAAGVKKAMTTRVFGFEILPAPYVVAHLQLGVLLKSLGAGLASSERTGVYLTNALTGWEPPKGEKATSAFKFLTDEQDAAAKVKREKPIIVILGNPPYNAFAGVAQAEEANLLQPYYVGIEEYKVTARTLNDLYIRFFRLAEKQLGGCRKAIVSYISNYSWLQGQSHPVMRRTLLDRFDTIYIDNLHGDRIIGERAPDGNSSETIFAMGAGASGIRVGTAIATLVGTDGPRSVNHTAVVMYRDFDQSRADKRRAALLTALNDAECPARYSALQPNPKLRYILVPGSSAAGYTDWVSLPELFTETSPGVQTARDEFLVDVDLPRLKQRIGRYFDKSVTDAEILEESPVAMTHTARFDAFHTRNQLVRRGIITTNFVRYSYRPLDDRWLYWEPLGKLLDEKRAEYFAQVWPGQLAFTAAAAIRKGSVEGPLPLLHLGGRHLIERGANIFTLFQLGTIDGQTTRPCIADKMLEAVCTARNAKMCELDGHTFTKDANEAAQAVFFHTIGLLWSPAYRAENEAALRQDWPRVPIPKHAGVLTASAALGRTVVDLLLPDKHVVGVTSGKLRAEFAALAIPTKIGSKAIDPDEDLEVTAGWCSVRADGQVSAREGKILPNDTDPDGAVDIYINDEVCWRNVPRDVWEMTIGGYPVVKKWLSYREHRVLGRALKMEEMTYITEVVRRLKALLLLGPELDANYRACAAETITLDAKRAAKARES